MSDGTTTDWGALAAVVSTFLAGIGLVWKIGMDGRNAIIKRLDEVDQTADDDRKQVRQLESEIARNYVSRTEFTALDARTMAALGQLSADLRGLSTEMNRKFDELYRMLMEKSGR